MNLKWVFEWYCLAECIGSSSECVLILDARKKENHPSEMLFAWSLSCRLEIMPCIPSKEEAQASSPQYIHPPNAIIIVLSQLRGIFFHPSQYVCLVQHLMQARHTQQ